MLRRPKKDDTQNTVYIYDYTLLVIPCYIVIDILHVNVVIRVINCYFMILQITCY